MIYGVQNDLFEDEHGRRLKLAYDCDAVDDVVAGDLIRRAESHRIQEALGETVPFRRQRTGTDPRC